MTDAPTTLQSILREAGFGSSGIDRIKLGSGVVGKLTTAQMGLYVICFATVAAGAWLHANEMVFIGLALAGVSFLYSSLASMWFASKHPAAALLEGAELVSYHQIEMAAKDTQIPMSQANTSAPLIVQSEAGRE